MYVDIKLIGISLAWTYFKKEHCKYRIFTKGLSFIFRNLFCNKQVTKAVSLLHDYWDLWCRFSVCLPLTFIFISERAKMFTMHVNNKAFMQKEILRCPSRHVC